MQTIKPNLFSLRAGIFLFFAATPTAVSASNGMNLIGHGTRTIAMGGAGSAITDDGSAMILNPAGLAFIKDRKLEFGGTFMFPNVTHSDNIGNQANDTLTRIPSPYITFAQSHNSNWGHWAWGIGVFLQGGLGVEYDKLITPFSAREKAGLLPDPAETIPAFDRLKTKMAHVKFTPTIAWQATDNLNVGVSLHISYSRAALEIFPETSVNMGTMKFSGIAIEDLHKWGVGVSAGAQYHTGDWQFGASYTSRTNLGLSQGKASANMKALGLGKVGYDAELNGFSWPQQTNFGIGYHITPKILIAVDYSWIDWSSTHDQLTVSLSNPEQASAPASVKNPMALNWRDQHVLKVGMEWNATDALQIRLGLNHSQRPMRQTDLRTQFPAIAQTHYTAGFSYGFDKWELAATIEYVPNSSVTNNNADQSVNLLGAGSQTSLQQTALGFSLSRTF